MATKWYFRDSNALTGPSGKASPDTDSFPSVPADKNTPKNMTSAKGNAQKSVAGAYITGTSPLYTMARMFVGPALAAQTLTGAQTGYQVGIAILESSAFMNLYHRTFVYVWRSGSGNVKTIGGPVSCGTEHGTAERGCVITFNGNSGDFNILPNDRIVVEEWWDIRNTKNASYTATFYYDGATDVVEATATSDAAGFFYCPQTLARVLTGWRGLQYLTEPPSAGWNKLKYASEPPVTGAWNQILYSTLPIDYYNVDDDGGLPFYDYVWAAQTFGASQSYTIKSVKLKLYKLGTPGIITVSIRATTVQDGQYIPTGSDLCSGTTNGNTLPGTPGTWREISLGAGTPLVGGTTYAIVVRRLGSTPTYNEPYWREDGPVTPPPYAEGTMCLSGDSGLSWIVWTENDCMFETYN